MTDRAGIRTDIVYTLIHRLGLFRLAMFFMLAPLSDLLEGHLRLVGWRTKRAVYWATNTLDEAIPNSRLLAIVESMRRIKH